jgi:hypothetical protein
VTEQAAVQNDPVRIADDVMAYLTSKGAINEAIDLKTQFEGKTFQFYLVRLRSENKDIILVDYDGRCLQVELFAMGDPSARLFRSKSILRPPRDRSSRKMPCSIPARS